MAKDSDQKNQCEIFNFGGQCQCAVNHNPETSQCLDDATLQSAVIFSVKSFKGCAVLKILLKSPVTQRRCPSVCSSVACLSQVAATQIQYVSCRL